MKKVEAFEETIHLDVDGRSMDVHIAAPLGQGPHPGVLLMFHRGGMDACTAYYMKELPLATSRWCQISTTTVRRMCHCMIARNSSRTLRSSAKSPPLPIIHLGGRTSITAVTLSWGTAWAVGSRFLAPARNRYSRPLLSITVAE